jgi:hypothetical protein
MFRYATYKIAEARILGLKKNRQCAGPAIWTNSPPTEQSRECAMSYKVRGS